MNKKMIISIIIITFLACCLVFLFLSCKSISKIITKGPRTISKGNVIINDPSEEGVISSVDILVKDFFSQLRPWKDGKLATIDGWGRFAEISFAGENRVIKTTLVDFPGTEHDLWRFNTWPEAGLIMSSTSDILLHLAAIDDRKTKSHVPMFTRTDNVNNPVLLDPDEGLIAYVYEYGVGVYDLDELTTTLFVYNYKTDTMVYESPFSRDPDTGFRIGMYIAINKHYTLAYKKIPADGGHEDDIIFYNWRSDEIIRNDLTEALNKHNISVYVKPNFNICVERRYMIGTIIHRRSGKANKYEKVKINWDEDFTNIKMASLSYLFPDEKEPEDFLISSDGLWGTTQFYDKEFDEVWLYRRVFFHFDEKYPNGISPAVYADDYEESDRGFCAFVQHPVYGLCLAQAVHNMLGNKEQEVLRFYKMDDVLAELNK